MALFGKKKPKQNKNIVTPQVEQGDFYDRIFRQQDENDRLFREQIQAEALKSGNLNNASMPSNNVGNNVAMNVPAPMNSFESEIQKTQSTSQDTSYAKTDVMASRHKKSIATTCSVKAGIGQSIGKRDSQQDAANYSDINNLNNLSGKWIAVLCDGMGGMSGGEKASALSVDMMMNAFSKIGNATVPTFYRNTLIEIDDAVYSIQDEYGNLLGAGSTLISVIIDGDNLYWASVGDSHIYIIRGMEMIRVNKEHNYFEELKEMVNRGQITMEEAINDRNKDALTSYMGIGSLHLMDVIEKPFKLEKDDFIILCSDGLYRSASDNEIYKTVIDYSNDMQLAAKKLVDCAISKNKKYQDNTTVIAIRY